MNVWRRIAAIMGICAVTIAGCTKESDLIDNVRGFGYQVATSLDTTNAASNHGASVEASVLAARIYPGTYVAGPSGQLIPNTDLVSAQPIPGPNPQVQYVIADKAVFSDGAPITCMDFQLAFVAGKLTEIFDSHLPLMSQVESVTCRPESKTFTATFAPGQGARWRNLFGPGTLLPSHAIARKAGLEEQAFADALNNLDPAALAPVADMWNNGFSLEHFDPDLQVSSGPFVIDRVGDSGEVVLKRNDNYYGEPAQLERLVVWPAEASTSDLVSHNALQIAETASAAPDWLDRDNPKNRFELKSIAGELTDSLRLSRTGVFDSPEKRQAFAACIDRTVVAQASSSSSGVQVKPVVVHTIGHADPLAQYLEDIDNPHAQPDIGRAGELRDQSIRISYHGPDARKAAMVKAIGSSCRQAGITVVDASGDGAGIGDLGTPLRPGTIDAFLGPVDPSTEYPTVSAKLTDTSKLRDAETAMWQDVPAVPLSETPRTFVYNRAVGNVVVYSGLPGIGWNMDRWNIADGSTDDK